MYMYADGTGWTVAPVMFVLMIVVGAFFLLNLTLAVLGNHFDSTMEKLEEDAREMKAKIKLVNSLIRMFRKRKTLRLQAEKIAIALNRIEGEGGGDEAAEIGDMKASIDSTGINNDSESKGESGVSRSGSPAAGMFLARMAGVMNEKDQPAKSQVCV